MGNTTSEHRRVTILGDEPGWTIAYGLLAIPVLVGYASTMWALLRYVGEFGSVAFASLSALAG